MRLLFVVLMEVGAATDGMGHRWHCECTTQVEGRTLLWMVGRARGETYEKDANERFCEREQSVITSQL